MAVNDDVPMNPEYMDYAEHERTFKGFLFFTKWGVVAVVGVILILAFLTM